MPRAVGRNAVGVGAVTGGGAVTGTRARPCGCGRLRAIPPDGNVCIPSGDAQRSMPPVCALLARRGAAAHVEPLLGLRK